MSTKSKSIAVITSAVMPVLLVALPASAGLTQSLKGVTANWPTSSIGAKPSISSGSSTGTPPGGPNAADVAGTTNQSQTLTTGSIVSETFTTGAGFTLGAIDLVAGGGAATNNANTLHLFQLNSSYSPTNTSYKLDPSSGGQEVGNDLLGGGNGLNFTVQASGDSIYEFDFNNTGTSDQITLLPNTSYALELWGDPNGNGGSTFFQTSPNSQSYLGGQAYQISPANFTATSQTDHSPDSRLPVGATPRNLLFAVYSNTLVIPGPAFWNIGTSGNWDIASNWSSQAVPNAIGVEADFLSPTSQVGAPQTKNGISAPGNVFTDTAKTVGIMNFDNGSGYVIDGAGSLTLQTSSGNATVNVLSGTQKINLPLTIASNTTFNVSNGATLKISDPMTINTGTTLTSNGGVGTVTYESIVTVNGSGQITLAAPTVMHALVLSGATSKAVVSPHGASVNLLQLDSLTTVAGSQLDLSNNSLILHGGPVLSVAAQLSTVQTALKNGFNAHVGYWNGTNGIVSSTAAADTRHLTTLGYMQSTGGTFAGTATTTNDVLVKYTYYGDANLDGVVNGADYQQIDMGYGSGGTTWSTGDFNYDGVVNGSDFALIDNTFNQISATGAGSLAQIASPSDLIAPAVSAVPEPTALGLLALGAASVLGRRSRKQL